MNDSASYYEILDVDQSAGRDEVEASYRRLAGPLRAQADGDPAAQSRLRRLDEAFITLSDPVLRARYDAGLKSPPRVVREPDREPDEPAAGEALRRRIPWGVAEVVQGVGAALALFLFLGLVVLGVLAVVYPADSLGIRASALVLSLALELGLFGTAWWLTVRRFRVRWQALGFRALQSRWIWVPVATAIAGFVIVWVVLVFYSALGYDAQQDTSQLTERRVLLPLAGVMVVLAAPLAEETFFRGLVFGGLLKRFGFWRAALASGFMFGAAHVTGPASAGLVLPFTGIGAMFAYVYYRTGSLWASIGAHLVFNAVSFTLLAANS